MAVSLPDVIGEYIDRPERFATGGLQYAGYFEPATIAPEEVSYLYLFLQNTLNAPLTVNFKFKVPSTGGFLRSGQNLLKVHKPNIEVSMDVAEAGLLTLPVTTTEALQKNGNYDLVIEPKVSVKGRSERMRPAKSRSQLSKAFFDDPVGLNVVGTMGATFVEKSVNKAAFTLAVAGKPNPPERALRLEHKYQVIWTLDQMDLFNRAVRELNLREVKLQEELSVESLYAMLYAESTVRLADTGLPLRIGEAIVLAKILTYCCQYFLSSADRRNGLLVPIWERALGADINTTDVTEVMRLAGYHHILKLAIAMSFGLVARALRRQPWSSVERQVVTNLIAEKIEVGEEMDVDFLYLPLLMAGALISNKVVLAGEDPRQSLTLLKQAYEARSELFDDAEMEQGDQIFQQILKQAMQEA